jgi:hypothetical protein
MWTRLTLFRVKLFDKNHAGVLRRRLPDSFGLLIGGIVVEPERGFLRWEPDDGVHRACRAFHEQGCGVRRQDHAAVFGQERHDDGRVLLELVRIDDVVAADVERCHGESLL